jgi:hypothetical protein
VDENRNEQQTGAGSSVVDALKSRELVLPVSLPAGCAEPTGAWS